MSEDVLDRLRRILCSQFRLDHASIVPGARLKEDLGLDSIDLFDLLALWETENGVSLDPDRFRGVKTVDDLMRRFSDFQK